MEVSACLLRLSREKRVPRYLNLIKSQLNSSDTGVGICSSQSTLPAEHDIIRDQAINESRASCGVTSDRHGSVLRLFVE